MSRKIYLVSEDSYCGVHPIAAFTNQDAAEKYAKKYKEHLGHGYIIVQEIPLYDNIDEAIND